MERASAIPPTPDPDAARQLHELPEADCWELIDTDVVGRLAWSGSDGLTVVPVNYTVDGRNILVRTTAYSAVARECDDSSVAFEVDHHDPVTRTGWSVLVRGHARIDFDAVGDAPEVDVWPDGIRSLHVRVEPSQISGRRLRVDS